MHYAYDFFNIDIYFWLLDKHSLKYFLKLISD